MTKISADRKNTREERLEGQRGEGVEGGGGQRRGDRGKEEGKRQGEVERRGKAERDW